MEVSDADLARRREGRTPPKPPIDRGYWKLYIDHVLGADTGANLDFFGWEVWDAGFAGESLKLRCLYVCQSYIHSKLPVLSVR